MKRIILTCICSMVAITSTYSQGIKFEQTLSWAQVQAKAKAENKYIFMDLFTTWCMPCKKMDDQTFPIKEIGDLVNTQFISIKMQMDQTKNDPEYVKRAYVDAQTIMKQYQINAFPTFLFFSPEGKLINRVMGFKDVKEFIEEVKKVMAPGKKYDEMLEEYAKGKLDTGSLRALALQASKLGDKVNAEKIAADYTSRLSTKEWYKKENLIFTGQFLRNSNDPNYKLFVTESAKIDSIGGKGFSESMIKWLVYREMEAYDKAPQVDWAKTEKNMLAAYGPVAKDYIFQSKLRYYAAKSDWATYGNIYKAFFDDVLPGMTSRPPFMINNFSWKVVEHITDAGVLVTAIKAMKYDLDKLDGDKNPANIDTYANLLYKAGKKPEAIEWEEKAVMLSNNDKSFIETLEKMKQGQLVFK